MGGRKLSCWGGLICREPNGSDPAGADSTVRPDSDHLPLSPAGPGEAPRIQQVSREHEDLVGKGLVAHGGR